jgi:hypothetical protein
MTRLLLGNLEPETSDDEIREFLERYGFPPFNEIERQAGDGSQPAAVLTFAGADPFALGVFQRRIDKIHWKQRRLSAQILRDSFQ